MVFYNNPLVQNKINQFNSSLFDNNKIYYFIIPAQSFILARQTHPMYHKVINTQMKLSKENKHKKISQQLIPSSIIDPQQNFLLDKYEPKQQDKILRLKRIQQAEKLIMKQKIKEIVTENLQYFRNILQVKQLGRPNTHMLKLPSKTVQTHYRRDFSKRTQYDSKNASVDMKRSYLQRGKNFSQLKLPLTTTYQEQFKKNTSLTLKQKRNSDQSVIQLKHKKTISENAPVFLDTQNSLQFRNWGVGSVMPSMKPAVHAATTQIPFKANTMYRSDFHDLILPKKTKPITHQQTFPHSIDLWMGKSSYCENFNKKKVQARQKPLKPIQNKGATGLPFTYNTQYRQQFVESIIPNNMDKIKQKKSKTYSNEDIQKIILNL